jgi:hypothetical protein
MSFFLTAFDPSDVPGSSVDPLGFDRAYNTLADLLLPGLTNVARRPRCFAVLCAGSTLAELDSGATPRAQYAARVEAVLRIERLWALGHALAAHSASDEHDDDDEDNEAMTQGVRGIRYAQAQAARLRERDAQETSLDFQLLSRQVTYGIIGIYGFISEGLRLLDRDTLRLTPDLGARLGEAFCRETKIPAAVRDGVREGRKVSVRSLEEWTRRAHISGETGSGESECYAEILDN